MKPRRLFPRLLLIAAVIAAVVWAGLHRERFDPQALDVWLSGLGLWAPVVYVLVYIAGTVMFVPGSLLTLAGGALFGPVWGTAINLTGATAGATVAFLIARYLASEWVAHKARGGLKRLIAGVEAEGWRFVAFVRLVPLFPFNLTNYALGLTRIGIVSYAVTSFVCMVPGAIAYSWLGHAGREALAGETEAIRYGLVGLALLAAIAFLPRLWRRIRAAPRWTWLDAGELKRRIDAHEDLTVVDVRGTDEFVGPLGHIAGARNLPVDSLPDHTGELAGREQTPVVLVCRTDKRSAKAADLLRAAGFADVAVLRGGMERWNADGLPVERGAVQGTA